MSDILPGIPVDTPEVIENHNNDGSKVTAAYRRGYVKMFEEFGDFGTGKTTRAKAFAQKLKKNGKQVIIDDDLMINGKSGVRVYAR
jgi:adenylylsulfate kinase-like enzyme